MYRYTRSDITKDDISTYINGDLLTGNRTENDLARYFAQLPFCDQVDIAMNTRSNYGAIKRLRDLFDCYEICNAMERSRLIFAEVFRRSINRNDLYLSHFINIFNPAYTLEGKYFCIDLLLEIARISYHEEDTNYKTKLFEILLCRNTFYKNSSELYNYCVTKPEPLVIKLLADIVVAIDTEVTEYTEKGDQEKELKHLYSLTAHLFAAILGSPSPQLILNTMRGSNVNCFTSVHNLVALGNEVQFRLLGSCSDDFKGILARIKGLLVACKSGYGSTPSYISSNPSDYSHEYVMKQNTHAINYILTYLNDYDPTQRDHRDGSTALHALLTTEELKGDIKLKIAHLLLNRVRLQHPPNQFEKFVNCACESGETALQLACQELDVDMVELLVSNGANFSSVELSYLKVQRGRVSYDSEEYKTINAIIDIMEKARMVEGQLGSILGYNGDTIHYGHWHESRSGAETFLEYYNQVPNDHSGLVKISESQVNAKITARHEQQPRYSHSSSFLPNSTQPKYPTSSATSVQAQSQNFGSLHYLKPVTLSEAQESLNEMIRKNTSSIEDREHLILSCNRLVSGGLCRYEDILNRVERCKTKERFVEELKKVIQEITVREIPSSNMESVDLAGPSSKSFDRFH
ncbi:ankyrin repeat domain-containing protein [Wolbachia endosymbiont of Tetranychus urticae]|uniref:ankyrin repeat domain-containing protein n=1 Tax=Wolbachia endosymbiont of Tetranychus urticae TaxID=169184 RepID=UPI00397CA085